MDFAASMVIFSTALLVVFFAWSYATQQNQQQLSYNIMENAATSASDSLVRHPGLPEDWNETTVLSIGLAASENVINESKAESFLKIDDYTIKKLLGIGNYDFYFEIRYDNGSLAYTPSGQALQKGMYPTTASVIIPAERHVIYMDRIANMMLLVWS